MHDLLLTAIEQPSMSGLLEMLRLITERTSSFGCILWQEVPPEGELGEPQLFVLADWFPGGIYCKNHSLSMVESRTGQAITKGLRQDVIRDAKSEIAKPDNLLKEANITTFVTTPVEFRDGARGAMNIYRNTPEAYTDETCAVARELARLVPLLYEIIRDRVNSALLASITDITGSFDVRTPPNITPRAHAAAALHKLCVAVADAFNCFEVSIFLEDPATAPERHVLAATTVELFAQQQAYIAGDGQGVTGWTLAHPDEHVRLFDLAGFDAAVVGKIYPGMGWRDSLKIREVMSNHPKIQGRVPPLSYMAAAILRGPRVAGVIRCSVAFGPWYFAPSEHTILRMVAAHIASFWGAILDRRDVDAENASLETLVDRMVELNDMVYGEFAKAKPNESTILSETLRITRSVIPDAVINDVRLLTDDGKELRFAETDGVAWSSGTPEEITTRLGRRYPLDKKSAGAQVIQTGEVYVMPDVTKDPYYLQNFPDAKRMIIAPIQLRDGTGKRHTAGVLDVRGIAEADFPAYAASIARLLGSQMALFRELKSLNDVHVRLNEDLAHQLTVPLLIARGRIQDALHDTKDAAIENRLLMVRGVVSRALHVSSNLDIFAKLEKGESIPIEYEEEMTVKDLVGLLINTGQDAAVLRETYETSKRPTGLWDGSFTPKLTAGVSYHVKTESFTKFEKDRIRIDRRLLEQVFTQILDNAFKYSNEGTTVEVDGGYTGAKPRELRIVVINEGIILEPDDARLIVNRGYQAENSKQYRQGGSGIGLWIVKEIMTALQGELDIKPTNDKGKTEIAVVFRVE